MRNEEQFRRGMAHLRLALRRFRPTADHLTPAHCDLVMLAVKGQNPKACLDVLAAHIFEIDPSATGVAAFEYLTYYYYGALAYVALHKWGEAIEFLNNVLVVPASALSTVMIAAYKTLLLVHCIAHGTAAQLPSGFSNGLEKMLRNMCGDYVDLANAFESGDDGKFHAAVDAGMGAFKADNNIGLVQQAVRAVKKQAIVRLTQIYVTLSLTQIAGMVGSSAADVEALLRTMIVSGAVRAAIDIERDTVSFDAASDAAALNAAAIAARLVRAEDLAERIRATNEDVVVSKGFVTRQLRDLPNLREVLHEFDMKQKRGSASVLDVFTGRM
jgi:COP9 signalosome complex subunit 3